MHICDVVLSGCLCNTNAQLGYTNMCAEIEAVINIQQTGTVSGALEDPSMFMR